MIHILTWSPDGVVTEVQDVSFLQKAVSDATQRFWADFDDPSQDELKLLRSLFHFHPLAVKAVRGFVGSPRLDIYEGYLFLVLHRVFYHFETETCELREFEVFFSDRFVVSTHPPQLARTFETTRSQIKNHRHELSLHGTSFVLSRILAMAIQDHVPAIEAWQGMLDEIETSVFKNSTSTDSVLERILAFKKLVSQMRKSLLPEQEIMREIYETKETTGIMKGVRPYFKVAYDSMNMLLRDLENLKDHAKSVFDVYAALLTIRVSESSHQLNYVMQRLTIAATIFLPLTFIVGVYGMNFKFMPELAWKWGYFAIWGVVVAVVSGMLYFFRKKKWM